jgi:hypothetical protein
MIKKYMMFKRSVGIIHQRKMPVSIVTHGFPNYSFGQCSLLLNMIIFLFADQYGYMPYLKNITMDESSTELGDIQIGNNALYAQISRNYFIVQMNLMPQTHEYTNIRSVLRQVAHAYDTKEITDTNTLREFLQNLSETNM